MNKKGLLCAVLALAVCFTVAGCNKKPVDSGNGGIDRNWDVKSPDGSIVASMQLENDGKMYYTVDKGETQVVHKSEMGFDIQEDDFNSAKLYSVNSRRVSGEYENKTGKRKYVTYDCNETTVTLKGYSFYFDVIMRCYDDGYAFRYGIRKIDGSEGVMTVLEEKTQFALPEKTRIWAMEYAANGNYNAFSYERAYNRYSAQDLVPTQSLTMPLLYKVNKTNIYSLIAQSELIGSSYYGTFLHTPEEGSGVLQPEHNRAGAVLYDDRVDYPFKSPWRAGITGDLKTVEESELVEKLYDDVEYWKPDNYDELSPEEKEIYNYDWVEPGACAWSWLYYQGDERFDFNPGSINYQYVDLADRMGWKYILLDGGWQTNLDKNKFAKFVDYAHERNIKVIVWMDSINNFGKCDIEVLRAQLDELAGMGVSGIKPDFFDGLYTADAPHKGEDIDHIKWYETMYQECAKRKMLIDCHGCNAPTGERRKYPNAMMREAVFGNEERHIGSHTTINQLLIRQVVGGTDFTPVVNPRNPSLLTPAHQLALSFLFEAGMPMYGDYAAAYEGIVNEFYKNMPTLRDETVFLDGEPDQLYAAAIRAEGQWYVGAVCDIEQEFTIDFSFLGEGLYKAEVFEDSPSGLTRKKITVTKNDKITYQLSEKGGVVLRLVPIK